MAKMLFSTQNCKGVTSGTTGRSYDTESKGFVHVDDPRDIKALKAKIPRQERNEWENWITTSRAEIHALTAEIAGLEAEINGKVYDLFDLTPAEITLLESNI